MNRFWRAALQERVVRRCGEPDRRFSRHGHTFGDWIDASAGAAGPGFTEVEAGLAGYFGVAARTGRRWGTVAGAVLGTGGALVAFVVVRLVA